MSTTIVRVNLLPREVEERQRGRQVLTLTVGMIVLFVALLGAAYVMKLGEISSAQEEREQVQAELTRLQARVAQLEEYRQLDERRVARAQLLAAAMATEISWSAALNDLSLAFPTSASLTGLTAGVVPLDELAEPGSVSFGDPVANMSFTGYSVERYAPGVESVIIQFAKIPSLFNTYLTMAGTGEIGATDVTNFTGTAQMDDQAYTRRYAEGLPLEVAR